MKRRQNKKPISFYDETLSLNFWFFLGWSPQDFHKYCSGYFSYDPSEIELEKNGGYCIEFASKKGNHAIVIWTKEKPVKPYYIGTLAHECVHAVNIAFNCRGIKPDLENDEHQAYLVTALVRRALNWNYKTHTN